MKPHNDLLGPRTSRPYRDGFLGSSAYSPFDFGSIYPPTEMQECSHGWARQNLLLLWIWWLLTSVKESWLSCCVYFNLPPLEEALLPSVWNIPPPHQAKKLNAMRYVNSTLWLKNYISWTSRGLKGLIDQAFIASFFLRAGILKAMVFSLQS